jgi:alkylation response protein AidB-like acyl-CoA dehydrogenase
VIDFSPTDEQLLVRETVRAFVDRELRPHDDEVEKLGHVPPELADAIRRKAIDAGLYAMNMPVELGGGGLDYVTQVYAEEELAKAGAGLGVLVNRPAPILLACAGDQVEEYLLPTIRGDRGECFALTEPGAGSDAQALTTRAGRDGSDWVLDGSKRFITNAGVAMTYVVFARSDAGISAFLVHADDPGFQVGRIEPKMGIKGSTTGELLLDRCRIPGDRLIGEDGAGFRLAMQVLDRSRPGIAAQALGIAQAALDYSARYATERVAFGRPIADQQGLQFMLADMATAVEASRGLLYRVAAMLDAGTTGPELTRLSAMAKLACSDTAMQVTTDAVQILGGYGYIQEFPVERMMRDAKITQIYEGTNQIQRVVIARELLRQLG